MLRKRLIQAIAFGLVLSLMSGCVYLRLLKLKNQLYAFDENVTVELDQGLSLKFPEPVVRDEDFVFITESQPSSITAVSAEPKIEDWNWRFEKQILTFFDFGISWSPPSIGLAYLFWTFTYLPLSCRKFSKTQTPPTDLNRLRLKSV